MREHGGRGEGYDQERIRCKRVETRGGMKITSLFGEKSNITLICIRFKALFLLTAMFYMLQTGFRLQLSLVHDGLRLV